MERFFGIAQDAAGNIVPSCTVTVTVGGTATAATLYADNVYTPKINPFTSEADGAYQFYARDGRYDIVLTKTGFVFDDDDTDDIQLIDRCSLITPAQITATQDNYAPTNAVDASTWRISSDATRSITGITAGLSGQPVTLLNVGSFNINLAHASGSSVAANQFAVSGSRDFALFPDESVTIVYDPTTARWRVPIRQNTKPIHSINTVSTVQNTVVETTIYSRSTPGGLLGTNSRLRVIVFGRYTNTTGGNETATMRLYYGGSNIVGAGTCSLALTNALVTVAWGIEAYVVANAATNAQNGFIRGDAAAADTGVDRGTGAVDSTTDQTVQVTIQLSAASSALSMSRLAAVTEWLP